MKIGIVYYSRIGNMKHVAKTLEEKLKEKKLMWTSLKSSM